VTTRPGAGVEDEHQQYDPEPMQTGKFGELGHDSMIGAERRPSHHVIAPLPQVESRTAGAIRRNPVGSSIWSPVPGGMARLGRRTAFRRAW
jgi:hypothetical protein